MAAYELLNERTILVRDLPPDYRLPKLETIMGTLPGVVDAVQAFGTVALYFQDDIPGREAIDAALYGLAGEHSEPVRHEIPICFELGEDLSDSAARLSLKPEDLANTFLEADYKVEAIGFSPGFPYLSGLPKSLSGLPRMSSPRSRVEPGSIGLAEGNACIYPSATPGGWNLIARTPLKIVDLKQRHFPISVGDGVRFSRISASEFDSLRGKSL